MKKQTDIVSAARDVIEFKPYQYVNVESANKLGLRGPVIPAHGVWDAEERHAAARVDRFLSSY